MSRSLTRRLKDLAWSRMSTKQRFTRIYRNNHWGEGESVSGPGSTLAETETIRAQLPSILHDYGVSSLLDAPCGDMNWMSEVLESVDIDYVGIDIVEELIQSNRRRFPALDFRSGNIVSDDLPQADVILCNDCFIHLSNADIFASLQNFASTGAQYLLTNSYDAIEKNRNVATGRWRFINLHQDPFSFPAPLASIGTGQELDKKLNLYDLKSTVNDILSR